MLAQGDEENCIFNYPYLDRTTHEAPLGEYDLQLLLIRVPLNEPSPFHRIPSKPECFKGENLRGVKSNSYNATRLNHVQPRKPTQNTTLSPRLGALFVIVSTYTLGVRRQNSIPMLEH